MVNDYVIEKAKAYFERLTSVALASPAERGIERTHDSGLRGIGELFPSGQCFDIADAGLAGTFTGVCAERELPIFVHADEPVGHYYPGKTDIILRQIELFVEHSLNNDIILAHWGGWLAFFEIMPEIRKKFARALQLRRALPLRQQRL